MAILVQSFLNSATRLSTTATTATTVAQLKTLVNALEGVNTSTMQFYIVNPKFSQKWYEFDLGWMYIKGLEFFKLATLRTQ